MAVPCWSKIRMLLLLLLPLMMSGLQGSFSQLGLWVAERHSEAALAAVQGAARRAAASTGWL